MAAIGRLWTAGVQFDWPSFYAAQKRRRVELPGYAFNRQRHWVERDGLESLAAVPADTESTDKVQLLQLSKVDWTACEDLQTEFSLPSKILVIGHDTSKTNALESEFRTLGSSVTSVRFGQEYAALDDSNIVIRQQVLEDYEKLANVVADLEIDLVLHDADVGDEQDRDVGNDIANSFVSPLLLLQGFSGIDRLAVVFLSRGAYSVIGSETLSPLAALAAGPALVANLELPNLDVHGLDADDQPVADIARAVGSVLQLAADAPRVLAFRDDKLFSKSFVAFDIDETADGAALRGNCHLVTGGLSGLGFEVSKYLASVAGSRIAVLGQTALPPQERWDNWLKAHTTGDPISARIRKIHELETLGAIVSYYSADLADGKAMSLVFDDMVENMGTIDTIIHCAGALRDGPILTKEIDDALAVLAPKVQGTLHLATFAEHHQISNVVLFSSVSSLSGAPGQVDYVAANAFLDAFVPALQNRVPGQVVSLNWAAWGETGMTHRMANPMTQDTAQVAHPLIDECLLDQDGALVFSSQLSADKHWIIDEHRAAKSLKPIFPGTGFLELVKAAYEPLAADTAVKFSDVMFLCPFVLHNDDPREIRVQFEPWSLGTTFSVISQADAEDPDSWFVHMKGRIGSGTESLPDVDISEIRSRLGKNREHRNEQSAFLTFGSRWKNIRSLATGNNEALLELELEGPMSSDVETILSHPGMLDVATAGVLQLVDGYDPDTDFYVPIAYERIDFFGAMPARWICHIVYRAELSQPGDVVVFDVTIVDDDGRVLARFDEFMLKCIEDSESLVESRPPLSARTNPMALDVTSSPNETLQKRLDEFGIRPVDGVNSLLGLLNSRTTGQVAISAAPLLDVVADISSHSVTDRVAVESVIGGLDLASVETHLISHEAVLHAAVVASRDRLGDLKIAAYVQFDPLVPTTVSEIRRFTRSAVEDQFVPSKFVELEDFPVTKTGDIDRRALPDAFGDNDDFVAPNTETEKFLTKIWQDILGVDRISITDNFFDMGGHSLLGVRLLATIRRETGVRLEDVIVVTYTLEQVSAELEKRVTALNNEQEIAS